LDLATGDQVQRALEQALARQAGRITVDVRAVPFLDSYGIGLLIRAYNRANAQGQRLSVINPTDVVLSTLKLTGLVGILVMPPTADADPV
jgi:anti-anti-sigma factor